MLKFEDVSFGFDEDLFANVNFKLRPGEIAVLTGKNGVGKSTLLRLCNGLLKPTRGKVSVAGFMTDEHKTSALARHAGFLFQNPDRQISKHTVAEELLFGLSLTAPDNQNIEEAEKQALLADITEEFGLSPEDEIFTLSKGYRQLVAIASVLITKPSVLLFDEPTVCLDKNQKKTLADSLSKRVKSGVAALVISHDLDFIDLLDCKKLILKDKEIKE
ncbi:MAG: energy-coupling factor ABC transporter ATP-binding protein [Ruminococcus sp.]|jgi:energy-coupling factor transport system ATP-binding protein|nr:energy-coupling factor ABC transporter ATP-binding protein [Ruminococcus sp.]